MECAEAVVQDAVTPKPEKANQLETNVPGIKTVATEPPYLSGLPFEAVARHYLRQEPSAVVPLAGICAGGAG